MTDTPWKERRRRLLDVLARARAERRGRGETAQDSPAPRVERRGGPGPRGNRRMRLRTPLLGAVVAGVGFPLVAGRPAPAPRTGVEASASLRRAAEARREIVDRAVDRFGIDRALAEDIHDVAASEGVSPSVAFGLVHAESSFRERVVSYAGALGLTQVLPSTARWVLDAPADREALFDRHTNLRAGFRYLRYLEERYDGDLRLALVAYNRGPGTVEDVLGKGVDPDNGYADRVLEHAI